jgi:ABC-type hemin transport system substrate-binding protein
MPSQDVEVKVNVTSFNDTNSLATDLAFTDKTSTSQSLFFSDADSFQFMRTSVFFVLSHKGSSASAAGGNLTAASLNYAKINV